MPEEPNWEIKVRKEKERIHKSLYFASLILIFHILLIAGVGCLVLFLRGVVNNMLWIVLACLTGAGIAAFLIYRRMKQERKSLGEILSSPVFSGRSVEVSLLGGMASVKIGNQSNKPNPRLALETGINPGPAIPRLEDPAATRIRELMELARLFEKDLITLDEYNKTKREIINR